MTTTGRPSLYQLVEAVGELRTETRHASESRRVIHEKLDKQDIVLDETIKRLAEMAFTLKVTTDVAVQARDRSDAAIHKIDEFTQEFREKHLPVLISATTFKNEAEPILRIIRTIRMILIALLSVAGASFGTLIAIATFADGVAKDAVRAWLGI